MFKPTTQSSISFSYGTSFNPSAENLALAAANFALPPEKDRTYCEVIRNLKLRLISVQCPIQ